MSEIKDTEVTEPLKLPSPPFVEVAGIFNFRDIGGYPVSALSNHSIKRGVIYRCADPSNVTKDGIAAMAQLGITHLYDLRSNTEIERARAAGLGGVVEWDGCTRVLVPVFADKDYSPEKLAVRYTYYLSGIEGFMKAYGDILTAAPASYRPILLHLAYEPSKPLVVHCTAGKDRTGVLCALILSLCGVEDEVIAHEYSLTEVGLTSEWKEAILDHMMRNPALKGNRAGALNMIGSKAENMLAFLKIIREEFGGPEAYAIKNCGLTKDEIEKIRSNLIVEAAALHQKVPHTL